MRTELTAQARAVVAAGRGRELTFMPGWWYVICAESFPDRVTEVPDTPAFERAAFRRVCWMPNGRLGLPQTAKGRRFANQTFGHRGARYCFRARIFAARTVNCTASSKLPILV
jgi:hypothetical protein